MADPLNDWYGADPTPPPPQEHSHGLFGGGNLAPIAIGLYLSHQWRQMSPEQQAANHPFNGFFGKIALAMYLFMALFVVLFLFFGAIYVFVVVQSLIGWAVNGFPSDV